MPGGGVAAGRADTVAARETPTTRNSNLPSRTADPADAAPSVAGSATSVAGDGIEYDALGVDFDDVSGTQPHNIPALVMIPAA